ncbi:unnamed protein product [Mesocestoides corti]|uniref:PNK FHA domain-containing protein n=2 Tax=Mesocestoides corti TaxID=53468 RepID=A0A0R3U7V3_MESCO|nr:unnamed protein product [Mesocestoides corti]
MPKRKISGADEAEPTKKLKQTTLVGVSTNVTDGAWHQNSSLLTFNPPEAKSSSKVLALDLDGTIIVTASGKVFPKNTHDWKLFSKKAPAILQQYVEDGYLIVIVSNQAGLEKNSAKLIGEFKAKVEAVVARLGVAVRGYFALKDDINRKPRTGMWQALQAANDGVEIDKAASIYCGDAAGREALGKVRKDHSHCDRLFAENVGIPFRTPEEFWEEPEADCRDTYPLTFDPRTLLSCATSLPPLAIGTPTTPTLVVMVGFPACKVFSLQVVHISHPLAFESHHFSKNSDGSKAPLQVPDSDVLLSLSKQPWFVLRAFYSPFCLISAGKSTFCNNHLQPLGFKIVSRDVIKDMKKCAKVAEEHLSRGSSVVIDNTNVDAESRAPFVGMAKRLGVAVYACLMATSLEHSRHNEMFRQLTSEKHTKINSVVFNMMKAKYKAPTKDEGFAEVMEIPFVPDLPDKHRELYFQYLLEK